MADHDISKALRSLRRQLGITQDALSKELHISRQLYAFYENGVRIPDAEMACELADFHHLTVNQLVHGQSSPEEAVLSSPSLTPASGEFFGFIFLYLQKTSMLSVLILNFSISLPKNPDMLSFRCKSYNVLFREAPIQ